MQVVLKDMYPTYRKHHIMLLFKQIIQIKSDKSTQELYFTTYLQISSNLIKLINIFFLQVYLNVHQFASSDHPTI